MSWKKERMHIDLFAIGSASPDTTGTQMSYKDEKKKQGKKSAMMKKTEPDRKPGRPGDSFPGHQAPKLPQKPKKEQDAQKKKP